MRQRTAMKASLVLLTLLALGLKTRAEFFLGVTSATNRFLIGTNEAVLIRTDSFSSGDLQFLKDGNTHTLNLQGPSSPPMAVVGPGEIVVTSSALFSFARIPTNGLQTILLPPAIGTNSEFKFSVAAGKNIRFFFPLSAPEAKFDRGTNSVTRNIFATIRDFGPIEVSGPVEVTLSNRLGSRSALATVAETDESVLVPQGIIQGPTGAFQIAVEKSSNLINWTPAILQDIREDQKAFYRLRIAK